MNNGERKRIAVLLGYAYPHTGATWTVVWRMLLALRDDFDLLIVTQRVRNHSLGCSFNYQGVRIVEVSDWWGDVSLALERRRILKAIWRVVYLVAGLFKRTFVFTYSITNTIRKFEEEHRLVPFSAVISVEGPSPSAHRVARLLKKKHPGIHWCAYGIDTIVGANIFHESGAFIFSLLRRIYWTGIVYDEWRNYLAADDVFFTPELINAHGEVCEQIGCRLHKLNYVLDLPKRLERRIKSDGKKHIVYGGMFYVDWRDPIWFIGVVRRLLNRFVCDFVFDFYLFGVAFRSDLEELAREFPMNVHVKQPVAVNRFARVLSNADILINFSNLLPQCAPSKMFTYIATGHPIIDIRYPKRRTHPMLLNYPNALFLVNGDDQDEAAERLNRFITTEAHDVSLEEIRRNYKDYLAENCFEELKTVLRQGVHQIRKEV